MISIKLTMLFPTVLTIGVFCSFFHCWFYREYRGISQKENKRSRCDTCGRILSVLDLTPSLGYVINKGKCKSCSTKIDNSSFKSETIFMGLSALTFLLFDDIKFILILNITLLSLSMYVALMVEKSKFIKQ